MNDETAALQSSPVRGFQVFSGVLVACGLLALVFVVLRMMEGGYPSSLEIQFRWYIVGAALTTIWFGWLGLVVSAIRERIDKKPIE